MNIKKLLVVGRGAKLAYNSAPCIEGSWGDEAYFAEDAEAAARILNENLLPGDIVLFKSSNGAGLRHLGDRIAETNQRRHAAAKEGSSTVIALIMGSGIALVFTMVTMPLFIRFLIKQAATARSSATTAPPPPHQARHPHHGRGRHRRRGGPRYFITHAAGAHGPATSGPSRASGLLVLLL